MSRMPAFTRTFVVALCLALSVVLAAPGASMAAKKKRHQRVDPNTLRALSFLAPNVPKRQLEKTVIKLARKAKVKPNRAGKALLGSLTRAGNKKQISKRRAIKPRAAATARMAGQFATLPPAENIGDIFYSPNSFLFVVYGHSGIYSSPNSIVESPGPPMVAREVDRTVANVFPGTQIARVVDDAGELLPLSQRQGAVDWAKSRLGDVYSWNWFDTQHIASGPVGTPENAQNCSQLIWAAYKTQGIDLDDIDWGPPGTLLAWIDRMFVLPYEMTISKHARIYQTI